MRLILFAFITLTLAACTTTAHRTEWVIDPADKPAMTQFLAVYAECKDFAYRSRVAGSRFSEADIHTSCIQRRGYQFKTVEVAQ